MSAGALSDPEGSGSDDGRTGLLEMFRATIGGGDQTECDSASEEDPPVISIPMSDFPPLPNRSSKYWIEPFCGIAVVATFSGMIIGLTTSTQATMPTTIGKRATVLVWVWATVAAACCAHLILLAPGTVKRSPRTCYPIPAKVEDRLLAGKGLKGLGNISGPPGSRRLGTYCVRCMVWRPPSRIAGKSHHCSTCQRCVVGFDHHCGVFGRCIVAGNLLAFYIMIGMLPAGMATGMIAVMSAGDPHPEE